MLKINKHNHYNLRLRQETVRLYRRFGGVWRENVFEKRNLRKGRDNPSI